MSLTYTKTETRYNEQKVQVTITSPKDWALFTSAANRSFQKRGETLIKKLEEASKDQSSKGFEKKIKAMIGYVQGYRKACKKSGTGASDTMVREIVFGFLEDCAKAVGVSEGTVRDVWDNA